MGGDGWGWVEMGGDGWVRARGIIHGIKLICVWTIIIDADVRRSDLHNTGLWIIEFKLLQLTMAIVNRLDVFQVKRLTRNLGSINLGS